MNRLVIFGAWYLADVIEELALERGWTVLGRVDPDPPIGTKCLDEIPLDARCFIAIGNNRTRAYVRDQLLDRGRQLVSIVHPSASVSPSATVGVGCYLGEYSVVRAQARVGPGTLLNAGSIVSHHASVGTCVTLGPGAVMASRSDVGDGAMLGAGATIVPTCRVGKAATVGAGATVVNAVPDGVTVVGNPARSLERTRPGSKEQESNWRLNRVW